MEKLTFQDTNEASVIRGGANTEALQAKGVYHVECVDADGVVRWRDEADNVVVNQGKHSMLDTYFAGSSYTALWYMSLITGGTASSGSVYATPGVSEVGAGVITGNLRPTMSFSAASGGAKSATTTSFAIGSNATIQGNMVVSGSNAVGNTGVSGGILFSAANFNAGPKTVFSGDTLNVTYSLSV